MTIGTLFLLAVASYIIMLVVSLRTLTLVGKAIHTLDIILKIQMGWLANWGKDPSIVKKNIEQIINDSKISRKKR